MFYTSLCTLVIYSIPCQARCGWEDQEGGTHRGFNNPNGSPFCRLIFHQPPYRPEVFHQDFPLALLRTGFILDLNKPGQLIGNDVHITKDDLRGI